MSRMRVCMSFFTMALASSCCCVGKFPWPRTFGPSLRSFDQRLRNVEEIYRDQTSCIAVDERTCADQPQPASATPPLDTLTAKRLRTPRYVLRAEALLC